MEGWLVKLLGFRLVPIAQVKLPGDWRKVLDDPSIPMRAASLKLVGQLQEPMVRRSDWKLIYGRRRVAAALYNGDEKVMCKVVECTDAEAELMAFIENAHREHMAPGDLGKLVAAVEKRVTEAQAANEVVFERPHVTKLSLPKAIAKEIVADAFGLSKETLKKNLQRERNRKARLKRTADHDSDLGIRSPWAELGDDFRKQTNHVVDVTNTAAQLLQKASQQLTLLANSGAPLHHARMTRVRESIALTAAALRGLLPTWLCVACKGVPALQPKCVTCEATGYITKNQEEGLPGILFSEEEPVALSGDTFVPLHQLYEMGA
jgi:ParB-like chromosome segregation protein Spo0J